MKTYDRESDGTTYYFKNGELYGAPSLVTGGFDENGELPVSAYEERPLTKEEIDDIVSHLEMKESDNPYRKGLTVDEEEKAHDLVEEYANEMLFAAVVRRFNIQSGDISPMTDRRLEKALADLKSVVEDFIQGV